MINKCQADLELYALETQSKAQRTCIVKMQKNCQNRRQINALSKIAFEKKST